MITNEYFEWDGHYIAYRIYFHEFMILKEELTKRCAKCGGPLGSHFSKFSTKGNTFGPSCCWTVWREHFIPIQTHGFDNQIVYI